jgi:predicted HD superfamily hydrolase involved in NAD metabolism
VPDSVLHQYAGEFLARTRYNVSDEDILNAIKYHTSGRENMSPLEELIFLADMVEPERNYDVVEKLRALFYEGNTLEKCMEEALKETLLHLEKKGAPVYALTREAYEFYKKKKNKE